MPSINDAYLNSLLAAASYEENLADGQTGDVLRSRLATRMTLPIAEFIAQNFTVETTIDTPDDIGGPGFDATVWRQNSDGRLFVSMRGTDGGAADFLTDADLAVNGAARRQFATMVNWWMRLTTPVGSSAAQIELANPLDVTNFFQLAPPAPGTGRLVGASNLTVNGHSLGGHLASAFHRLFGANGVVDHTYTFNSAGFLPNSEVVFRQLEALLGIGMRRYANSTEQTNYFAENGLNVTTNMFWFSQIGTRVPLFNEESTGIPNHYIYKLTDSLALTDAMRRLDSTLSFERANQILSRSGLTSNSLEGALDALRRVLLDPSALPLAISDAPNSPPARVAFQEALRAFSTAPEIASLADKLTLLPLSAQSIANYGNVAGSEFARFVELRALSPVGFFAQPGYESLLNGRLQTVYAADYTAWSADQALIPEQREHGQANFSDRYYADRATLLATVLERNFTNRTTGVVPIPGNSATFSAELNWYENGSVNTLIATPVNPNAPIALTISFADDTGRTLIGSNNSLGSRLYGGAGNDTLTGGTRNDYLEGGRGADVLDGGAGHDVLYGGAGLDDLTGGAGNDWLLGGADSDLRLEGGIDRDYLEGGDGLDNYYLSTSDTAVDTIFDADNAGRLYVDGTPISGFTSIRDGLYESTGGLYRMTVLGDAGGKRSASLYRASDNRTIANIIDIQGPTVLGYVLPPAPPGPSAPVTHVRLADSDLVRTWLLDGDPVNRIHVDADPSNGIDPPDELIDGGTANDYIEGGTFRNMEIRGGAGNDVLVDLKITTATEEAQQTVTIRGGAGSDFLYGRGGTMVLDGGADNDFISSARFDSAPVFTSYQRNSNGSLAELLTSTPAIMADMGALLSLSGPTTAGALGSYDTTLARWEFYYRPFAAGAVGAAGNLRGETGAPYSLVMRNDASGVYLGAPGIAPPLSLPVTQYTSSWTTGASDPLRAADVVVRRSDGGTLNTVIAQVRSNAVATATMARDGTDNSAELAFINGGDGDDIVFGGAGRDIVDGGIGDDRIDGAGGEDVIDGGQGNDFIVGGRFNDVVAGGAGNDILHGGGESDSLYGGDGDDTLLGDLYFTTYDSDGFVLSSQELQPSGADLLDGGSGNDILDGGIGNDVLFGGDGNDSLTGGAGNDVMHGGAGDDILISERGTGTGNDDVLDGGIGNDTYVFKSNLSVICDNIGSVDGIGSTALVDTGGIDTIRTNFHRMTLSHGIENMTLDGYAVNGGTVTGLQYEAWGRDTRARYVGNELNNTIDVSQLGQRANFLQSFLGGVVIDGGTGADTMIGSGQTGDTFIVDDAGDQVVETSAWFPGSTIRDRIVTPFATTLSGSLENLEEIQLVGTEAVAATGNARDNMLIGSTNTARNALSGGAGDDVYRIDLLDAVSESANEGNDTLSIDGGVLPAAGVTTVRLSDYANVENLQVFKGSARANLIGDAGANTIYGSAGGGTLDGGAGNDTIWDFDGSPYYDNLYRSFPGLPLNLSHVLLGGAGNDSMISFGGADVLDGGTGDDTLEARLDGRREIVYGAGYGRDSVSFSTVTQAAALRWTETTDFTQLRSALAGTTLRFTTGLAGDQLSLFGYNSASSSRLTIDQWKLDDGTAIGAGAINQFLTAGSTGVASSSADFIATPSTGGTLAGGDGNDVVLGGSGNDTLSGDAGDDVVGGGAGNDALFGGAGNDMLGGGSGNDTLDGGVGNDVLRGGAGDDVFLFSAGSGSDLIEVEAPGHAAGIDTIRFDASVRPQDVSLTFDPDGALIVTTAAGDRISARAADPGTDVFLTGGFSWTAGDTQSSVDRIEFADGTVWDHAELINRALVLRGTAGNDVLRGIRSIGTQLEGLAGHDQLYGGNANDRLYGGAGDDYLDAGNGDDLLDGGDNNDSLNGGAGNDELYGGAGNDSLNGGDGNDRLIDGVGTDTFRGGLGDDVLVAQGSGSTFAFARGDGHDLIDNHRSSGAATGELSFSFSGINQPDATLKHGDGSAFSDLVISVAGGTDTITVKNHFLQSAGVRADGISLIRFANGTTWDRATIDANTTGAIPPNTPTEGNDTLRGTAGNDVIDALGGDDIVYGDAGDDTLIGGLGNDQLLGEAGNDTLNGGAGNDVMTGGAGNDTFVVDAVGDSVIEVAGEGTDTVQSSITYALGANVEALTLTDAAAINASGNTLNNTITGNTAANRIDGGSGADLMAGGAGDDVYVVDNAGDVVTEASGAGIDTVESSLTYALAANVENLTLTGTAAIDATGNTLANMLTGNSAANRIDGGAGADTMAGGAGNDVYVVDNAGDIVIEAAGAGIDRVDSSVTYALAPDVENLTLTGAAAINATGNALANTLTGNAAANRLDGGSGADTMIGAAGDDTYVVDASGDVVTELAGGGIDTVESSITYTLGAEVENLILIGTSAINATGNALANTLTGNAGANRLDGKAGADTMIGGAGNDVYIVDNTGDIVIEDVGAGTDRVDSSVTTTLSANVENLTLTGTGAINGTGNTLNNVITGNAAANTLSGDAGNDTLNGGAGADTLIGGLGNDTYVVDSAGDVVIENAAEGTDKVQSSISYVLGANLENLTLTGAAAIDGTGNALVNSITGNGASNVLSGGAGNDTLTDSGGDNVFVGGAGNDTLNVTSAGVDRIAVARGHGIDTVVGSGTAANDVLEVSNGIVKSVMALKKTGNDLIVDLGAGESVKLKNWYAGVQNVGTLKIIGDAAWVPGQAGTPAQVETLSMAALAAAFDAARAANPTLARWPLDSFGAGSFAAISPVRLADDTPYAPTLASIDLETIVQPNLKSFMKFWNRPVPADLPTAASWFEEPADVEADGADMTADETAVVNDAADEMVSGAPRALSASGVSGDKFNDQAGGWAHALPAARMVASADTFAPSEFAHIQPAARTAPWWENGAAAAYVGGNGKPSRDISLPLVWETMHNDLAEQLVNASASALGSQVPETALSVITPGEGAEWHAAMLEQDTQRVVGRLSRNLR